MRTMPNDFHVLKYVSYHRCAVVNTVARTMVIAIAAAPQNLQNFIFAIIMKFPSISIFCDFCKTLYNTYSRFPPYE